jgi:hypothetical protein
MTTPVLTTFVIAEPCLPLCDVVRMHTGGLSPLPRPGTIGGGPGGRPGMNTVPGAVSKRGTRSARQQTLNKEAQKRYRWETNLVLTPRLGLYSVFSFHAAKLHCLKVISGMV